MSGAVRLTVIQPFSSVKAFAGSPAMTMKSLSPSSSPPSAAWPPRAYIIFAPLRLPCAAPDISTPSYCENAAGICPCVVKLSFVYTLSTAVHIRVAAL